MRNPQLVIGRDHLVGVDAYQSPNGGWTFNWVHLRRGKRSVSIHSQGQEVQSVQDLVKAIGQRYAICMVVRSERFMLRHIPGGFDSEGDLPKMLPNAEASSLVLEVITIQGRSHVAIARRQAIEPLLEDLSVAGLRITQLHIGPMVLLAVREPLPLVSREPVAGHAFLMDADQVTGYQFIPSASARQLDLGDETVDERSLLAFAAVWQSWFAVLDVKGTDLPILMSARKEERYRYVYELGQVVLLILLLALVGFDVGLRQRIGRDQEALEMLLVAQQQQAQELEDLEEAVDLRKSLIAAVAVGQRGEHMRIIDRVASSVPDVVVLTELWFSPVDVSNRHDEPFEPRSGIILLQGTVRDPAVLPEWLRTLRSARGVRNARLLSMERSGNEDRPVFQIELELA